MDKPASIRRIDLPQSARTVAACPAMERKLPWLELGVFAGALLALVFVATGGPGWDQSSGYAVLASQLHRTSAAPLYGLLAAAAAQLPVGEVGFRLGILGAVLGAATLAGVISAARALLSGDPLAGPLAGLVGAGLLVLAPPFRDAAAQASPSSLAACGAVWALAGALSHARLQASDGARAGRRSLALTLVGAAAVIGSAPWLGLALTAVLVVWLARRGAPRDQLAIGCGAIGLAMISWWPGAIGSLPPFDPDLTSMVGASGHGAAAILIGAGLLGTTFGALTGLPHARWLALVVSVTAAHAIVVDPAPGPLLAVLAIGAAIVPGGIARLVPQPRRTVAILGATLGAGVPLLGAAAVMGAGSAEGVLGTDDPGDAPARLATDVIGAMPPGPGVIVVTSPTTWSALDYALEVAGARPDLTLAPPLPPTTADTIVADALRARQLAVSDAPAFGRLDPSRALARGRGFELRGDEPQPIDPPPGPAAYPSMIGARQATMLALGRARYEAAHGRLDAAARAAGLEHRFHAAELAMLATTAPSRERPALFGLIPRLDALEPGPWRLELFGDDLAWVAGIEQPEIDAPPARKLHGLWRDVLRGTRKADDPEIAALGPIAVEATKQMLAATRP